MKPQLLLSAVLALAVVLIATREAASVRSLDPHPTTPPVLLSQDTVARVAAGGSRTGQEDWKLRAATEMAVDIAAIDIFAEVHAGGDSGPADFEIRVHSASEGGGCGLPLMLNGMTLGLIPGFAGHDRHYEFDITDLRRGISVRCVASYRGELSVGLWALVARRKPEWVRPSDQGSSEAFLPHFRRDISQVAHSLSTSESEAQAVELIAAAGRTIRCQTLTQPKTEEL